MKKRWHVSWRRESDYHGGDPTTLYLVFFPYLFDLFEDMFMS
jgi:hypothetical protein